MKNAMHLQSNARRTILLSLASLPLIGFAQPDSGSATEIGKFQQLESSMDGRLGVSAFDSASGRRLNYRADEKFPMCSTFKLMLVAAILKQATTQQDFMSKQIHYRNNELPHNSPVTEKHVADGMSINDLCAAVIQYSDNGAANLLMRALGGPKAVTAFARSIGDKEFRVDRFETMMSASVPGDIRDTTTPAAMAASLKRLATGDTLPTAQRDQWFAWMLGNTTGGTRIRAGVPAGWQVADKTGTGDYGTTNDVAILTPPGRAPIFLALYLTQTKKDTETRSDILAAATRIVVGAFA